MLFGICFTKFKNNQILLNKISHRFLVTTNLFTGWKSLIYRVDSGTKFELYPVHFFCLLCQPGILIRILQFGLMELKLSTFSIIFQSSWLGQLGRKAKFKCPLGMIKVNKFRHSYLNVMRLENYGPTGEYLNNNH